MKNVVGIKFRKEGKIYWFESPFTSLKKDTQVIVETENGLALGSVITEVREIRDEDVPSDLKPLIREVSEADDPVREENKRLEKTARTYCMDRIQARGLPMKLIDVECFFDKSKIVFFFTADNRVDFRELVKDLVQKFRIKIELRQIGARQEARMIKGLGVCGREVCCATLLHNLDRVTVKMAKEQNMSLNPEKISGLCGRLMCCLAFEYDAYLAMKKDMPRCGKVIDTPEGKGKVVRQNVPQGEVAVVLEGGKEIALNIKQKKD
ncbi:MAG: stage 0 sporulation family protein [Syntrophaceae bacterium]|nr:stage 0 sporulation family protein [Syntrophaceae bacterium]